MLSTVLSYESSVSSLVIYASALRSVIRLLQILRSLMLIACSRPVRSLISLAPACNVVRVTISSTVIGSVLDLFNASLTLAARLASGMSMPLEGCSVGSGDAILGEVARFSSNSITYIS